MIHSFITMIGTVSVCGDKDCITGLYLPNCNLPCMESGRNELLDEAEAQVNQYLNGTRKVFQLPIYYEYDDFSEDILDTICDIPYGTTSTFKDVAEASGHPGSYHKVSLVCTSNPIPLIIPCHRVIPSSGGVGSYIGGTIMKKRILECENIRIE